MTILDGLNDKQREAAQTSEGPVLILAGAGSGKTRALTHRIAYLIKEKNVRPESILAVTFTNKAANEMKSRVAKLMSPHPPATDYRLPTTNLFWLGTFHSICVKILRRESQNAGIRNDFTIFDSDDSLRAVKRAMRSLDISEKTYNPRAVRAYISQAKGEIITAKKYRDYAFEHFQEIVADVYVEYEKILQDSSALDFDDLLLKTVLIFQNNPSILEKYQRIFKYILVDEYQDTNHVQYIFLKLLAQKDRNIFVIGDDWQSIYSFRGAKFQNILDFQKDYPEAKVIYLEQNYRSTQPILDAAQKLIKNNEVRSDKNLFTRESGGAPVLVVASQDKTQESEFILDEIESLTVGEKRKLSEFVILYRINSQSRIFEESLIKRSVPYRIIGGVRFYERKEIKDILAYLQLILNKSNLIALSRVINVPSRGIGEKTVEKIFELRDKAKEEIPKYREFTKLLDEFRLKSPSLKLSDLVDLILDRTGYREFLSDGSPESEGRLENIEELKSAASVFETLEEFLQSVSLVSDLDNYSETDEVLTLMTVHAAKGLEFPVVFISGLEEGLFPHAQSLSDQFQLEEERRLFYVGMTRAMYRLYITFSKMRFNYGMLQPSLPSRFLDELPEEVERLDL